MFKKKFSIWETYCRCVNIKPILFSLFSKTFTYRGNIKSNIYICGNPFLYIQFTKRI